MHDDDVISFGLNLSVWAKRVKRLREVAFSQWQLDVYVPPVSSSPAVRSLSGCPCPSPLEKQTITTVTPDYHIQTPPIVNTVCALTADTEPERTTLCQSSAAPQH